MRRIRFLWPVRPAAILVAGLLLLTAACGDGTKKQLSGHFGPGQGGPPSGTATTIDLVKSDGTPIGQADYWVPNFTPLGGADDTQFGVLADTANQVGIIAVRISGRPDTPCRYQAAVLARDDGYKILESGDRKNDQDLGFHQVNLNDDTIWLSLFCTELSGNAGVMLQVTTDAEEKVDWLEVHALLNSIRKS